MTFTVAEGDERNAAVALLNETYRRDRGHTPSIEPGACFLIARDAHGTVAATFRFLGPETRPFDFEPLADVSGLRELDRRPALIGRLCVRPDHRMVRSGAFVHVGLLKLTLAYARKRAVTDLFLYTFDHLLALYRTAFFRSLGVGFVHPTWGPQNLMHLDVDGLEARCVASQSRIARLLLDRQAPGFLV